MPTGKHKNEAIETEAVIKGPDSLAQSRHCANYVHSAFGHLSARQERSPTHLYHLDRAQTCAELCLFLKK